MSLLKSNNYKKIVHYVLVGAAWICGLIMHPVYNHINICRTHIEQQKKKESIF